MDASQLILHLRNITGDHQSIRFSDYQLMGFLNDAISMVYDSFIGNANTLAKKLTTLTVTNGKASLPTDFHSVSLVDNMIPWAESTSPDSGYYKIIGSDFYCGESVAVMEYFYLPALITSSDDSVDIPRSLFNTVVNVAKLIMMGDRIGADNVIYKAMASMASRGVTFIPDRKAFE